MPDPRFSNPRSGGRLKVLPAHVVAQIAAGEVVERPASVVKELVENSLDAGARQITIDIRDGGRKAIRVADDGCGMSAADARLCLERHATSKLAGIDDLETLRTLGFRGEGLYSIAAVSRLTLHTRRKEDAEGMCIRVEGGERADVRPVGCRPGTIVEVQDLFYNAPARQKFLRNASTEAAHIQDVVVRLASAYPCVGFVLQHEGHPMREFAAGVDHLDRFEALLGCSRQQLGLCSYDEPSLEMRVEGAFLAPGQARTTAKHTLLVVNGRPVRDRILLQATLKGFSHLVGEGRYPPGVLWLEIDGRQLDVNVHPQKTEVRFAQPERVFQVVGNAIASIKWDTASAHSNQPRRIYRLETTAEGESSAPRLDGLPMADRAREAAARFWPASHQECTPRLTWAKGSVLAEVYDELARSAGESLHSGADSLRYIGCALGRVHIYEHRDRLLLVDASIGRVMVVYAALRDEWLSAQRIAGVELEVGLTIGTTPEVVARIEGVLEAFARLGLEIDVFGPGTVILRAVPKAFGWSRFDSQERVVRAAAGQLRAIGEDLATHRDVFDSAKAMEGLMWRLARWGAEFSSAVDAFGPGWVHRVKSIEDLLPEMAAEVAVPDGTAARIEGLLLVDPATLLGAPTSKD